MKTITVNQLATQIEKTPATILLDVRSPSEFSSIHAESAQNLPLDQISETTATQFSAKDHAVYLICQSGVRSQKACTKFQQLGYQDIYSVEGGTSAWAKAKLPTIQGQGSISIERQVRITAGALALAGAILASTHSPDWIWLSGFVGAGLAFAGITDNCVMGLIMAKMPWNR